MIPSPRGIKFKPFKGQTASKFSVPGTPKLETQEDYVTIGGQDDNPTICLPNTKFNSCPASPTLKPKSSINTSGAISLISDFYNKDQVGRAIDLVNSLHNRVQVVDHILKRRDEIKEMENQMKLARAGPIIKGLVSDFRKRMFKKGDSKSQGQFRKSLVALFAQEGPNAGTVIEDKNSDNPFRAGAYYTNYKKKKSNFISHQVTDETFSSVDQTSKQEPVEEKVPSKVIEDEVKVQQPKSARLNMYKFLETEHSSSTHRNSEAPNPSEKPSQQNQNGASFSQNKSPVPNTCRETEGDLILKQSLQLSKTKSVEDNKTLSSHRKKKRIPADSYELGKEAFKNELYKYMLKNENNVDDAIFNLGKAKQRTIKNIELDVKAKLEKLQGNKRSHSYQMASPTLQKGYSLDPLSAKGNMQEDYKTFFKNNIKSSKRNASQGQKNMRKSVDPTLKVDDESFVSFTETQLDNLYRQTHKIHNNLKVLDNKLESTEALKKWKNIEKTKIDKMNDLYHKNGEIMKLTQKKLTM